MALRIENDHIYLSVRDLVQINPKTRITLSSFPLPQRGALGQKAHRRTQQQKQHSFGLFHREVTVQGELDYHGFHFIIRGRIDGVYELKGRFEVEEIKSVILTAAEFKKLQIEKHPEFSEQVLLYSWLLQREHNGLEVKPYLTLVNLVNDKTRNFPVDYNPFQVERLLLSRLQIITDELQRMAEIREERRKMLERIDFSLGEKRKQQEEMQHAVEAALKTGKHLMVSAPTGTGKTAAALIPALQFALVENKKIFFATSKTTQQAIVQETLDMLRARGLNARMMTLRAARKMCANDVYFCHEDHCPFAKNYQQRLNDSDLLHELLAEQLIIPERVFAAAKDKTLCPSEVMFDLSVHCEVLAGDYNYVFDPSATLRRLFLQRDYSDWVLILDEAHNLPERGMGYFSPQLSRREIADRLRWLKKSRRKIDKQLVQGLQSIYDLLQEIQQEGENEHEGQQYFRVQPDRSAWRNAMEQFETAFIKYLIHKVRKRILVQDDPLEQLYYRLRHFVQVARLEEDSLICFYNAEQNGLLKIQCCDPSAHLGSRIAGFHSVIAMSATLDPIGYYRRLLGIPRDNVELLQLDSPYPTENRKIIIVPGLSTRYKHRTQQYPAYAEIIEKVITQKPGNYLAFFPSFEFMQNVNLFLGRVKCEKILQRISMSEAERDAVLEKLRDTEKPKLVLAVMGGIFAEGVDYSGDMCIGVIAFSPALPQITYERELIREYYQQKNGEGFEFAYIFPGMNKVIQAAGRLIRSRQDKGVIVLVGERFAEESLQNLFPEYWFEREGDVIITSEVEKELKKFWSNLDV